MRRGVTGGLARVAMCAALATTLGCADDAPVAAEILIGVSTDFAAGELTHLLVETLDVQGEQALDFRWLSVGDACPRRDDGLRALGTFSVQRGDQALARLRVVALRLGADGKALEVGRERVDALFARGRTTLDLTIAETCRTVVCAADQSCDPKIGACRALQRQALPATRSEDAAPRTGCITPLAEGPAEVVTRTTPATTRCVGGDGRCDAPCELSRDADCLHARGETCLATADCVDGALCVHGFCCDRPCSGACERCDLPERAGTCAPLRYLEARAPLASPDFAAVCDDRVAYACAAGSCRAHCVAGFADCKGALQDDGCETPLGTPSDCGACGDACTYGYCGEQRCTWHHTTELQTSATRQLSPNKLYASGYVPSSDDSVVRALGVLVHPELAGSTLRLALYAGNAAGFPDTLLAETKLLARTDATESELTRPEGSVLLEGAVQPVWIDPRKPYFVAVQVAQATLLFGGADTVMPWFVAPLKYDAFPAYFPLADTTEHELIALTMYAVTTPH